MFRQRAEFCLQFLFSASNSSLRQLFDFQLLDLLWLQSLRPCMQSAETLSPITSAMAAAGGVFAKTDRSDLVTA